jgi:hypothetical protein
MIEEEKLMRNVTVRMIWVMTFLMAGLVAGCGREQAVVQAPAVTATVPANGATVVPVKQVLTATFNLAMDPTTITTSTFTLTGPGGATVAGTVTFSGTTATFTPTASLGGSTLYTATITTGAKDVTGNPLPSNYVWTFTTGPIPVVVSTNPVNGATNVSRNQKIIATFSQPVTAATITAAGTFTVACGRCGNCDLCGGNQHSDILAHCDFGGQHPIHGHHHLGGAKRSGQQPGKQFRLEFYDRFDL